MPARLVLALALGAAFALGAWRARVLTPGGAAGGGALGALLVALGGGAWVAPAVAFFGLSSALSKVGRRRKATAARRAAKGDVRDLGQVAANGGVAALALVAHVLAPAAWAPACYAAFLGALATAAADTWATELGTLAPGRPRSVRTGRPVPPGTSGGVSAWGMLASAAGAASVAVAAWATGGAALAATGPARLVGAATLAGVVGALADSLLGATVQAQYRDPATGARTERPASAAGRHPLVRGHPRVTNDAVNAAATAVGALAAAGILG
jgi:uncharacterized protein (TIGR00297 family)